LDDDGERIFELPRHRGQVAHELVRDLADHAAALEVVEDPIEQVRRTQERQGLVLLTLAHLDDRRLLLKERLVVRVLQLLELA